MGGAAMVINSEKFSCEKLSIFVPKTLEVVWGLVKPKTPSVKYKSIIACSFYSPPNKMKNSKMADHIVSTLHMLYSKYPDSAIILGADKNKMDIKPILNCGLKLRNIVNQNTQPRENPGCDNHEYKRIIQIPPNCPTHPA